jgi:hypothetical protein
MANPKKKFNFYFDLKIYFIYFLILSLREERESYQKKKIKREKIIGGHDFGNQNSQH